MYSLIKKVLFSLDPELSHRFSLGLLRPAFSSKLLSAFASNVPSKPLQLLGLNFPNAVGLAAGLDKDGECIDAWFTLGFGFVELGTVTPRPQPGNPKPRLFRLVEAEALINRMGFNNQGVDHLVQNLKRRRLAGIVGVNIGKNKDTPLEKAIDDYRYCLEKVYPLADYVTLNISSPNTPGLRELQSEQYLNDLLSQLKEQQARLMQTHQHKVPLLVKIAPDLSDAELYSLADSLMKYEMEGVIATNTTLDRSAVSQFKESAEAGGLSGKPLFSKSTQVVEKLHTQCGPKLPIVGVGGIFSKEDAALKFSAGASLVQLYTGFIYRGPELIREIVQM